MFYIRFHVCQNLFGQNGTSSPPKKCNQPKNHHVSWTKKSPSFRWTCRYKSAIYGPALIPMGMAVYVWRRGTPGEVVMTHQWPNPVTTGGNLREYTPETNSSHLNLEKVISNRNLLFQGSIFRGYVSFREGSSFCLKINGWNLKIDLSLKRKIILNPEPPFLGSSC